MSGRTNIPVDILSLFFAKLAPAWARFFLLERVFQVPLVVVTAAV